jgi:hypothetical protein
MIAALTDGRIRLFGIDARLASDGEPPEPPLFNEEGLPFFCGLDPTGEETATRSILAWLLDDRTEIAKLRELQRAD